MIETGTITKQLNVEKPTEEFIKDILELDMSSIAEDELRLLDDYIKYNMKK